LKNIALAGLGYGFLITSHNTLALIFIPILFLYNLIFGKEDKNLLFSFKSLALGLGLSSFFWIPALYDKQFTVFDKIKVSDFSNYFISAKDFSLLGLISVFAILGSLMFLYKDKRGRPVYFFIVTVIAIFLSTSFSSVLWKEGLTGIYPLTGETIADQKKKGSRGTG